MTEEPTHHYKELEDEPEGRVRFQSSTPIFSVRNVPASIEHYVRVLGFQLVWDWGQPVTFACIGRGEVRLFLSEGSQGAPGTWLFLDVDDVDRLHAEYQVSGAKIIQPPTNFSWGRREMNVEDIDGHRLRLAGPPTGPGDGLPLAE